MRAPQIQTAEWMKVLSGLEDDPWAMALVPMLRLHWFIRLRWLFLAGAVAALALERFVRPEAQRPVALAGLLVALAAVNMIWWIVSHHLFREATENPASLRSRLRQLVIFANAQVAVDLLLLTGILRYTGGAENPLAIFYLFHMAIVSLLLKRSQAILQGVWALLLYTVLVVGEWQEWLTPHYTFLPSYPAGVSHALAVVFVVACGIFGTLYFTLHIARHSQTMEGQLQRANAALQQSQRAIQDLQRRRSRFMQTAAHQLKGPLAAIQTMTELIRSKIVPPEAIPGTCEKIVHRCQDGIAQVTELLTLARVQEADPARHRRSEADVSDVVREVYGRFKPLADGKQIEFVCEAPETGGLKVCVDPRDLRDCIGNLVDNGIKYTPAGGKVNVTVMPEQTNERLLGVMINVTDTGIGIDPSLVRSRDGEPGHEPVFDAFRRGVNAITAGITGSGLGLSIVREIVEQAGGRILVSSCPGQGSSFTLSFPSPTGVASQPQVRNTRISEIVLESPDTHPETQPGAARPATDA